MPPSDLLLRLGEYDLAEEEEPYLYQERRVQIVASHPQFDPRTFEYDLALLRFYEPVAFQPNIVPVCVPDSDENFIGRTAFVTGWGRLYEVFIIVINLISVDSCTVRHMCLLAFSRCGSASRCYTVLHVCFEYMRYHHLLYRTHPICKCILNCSDLPSWSLCHQVACRTVATP